MLGQTFVLPEMSKFNVCVCGGGGGARGEGRRSKLRGRGAEDKGEQEEGNRKGFI